MKSKNGLTKILLFSAGLAFGTSAFAAAPKQIHLPRIDAMADFPQPFGVIDFRKIAQDFDQKAYDFHATGPYWPLIWQDDTRKNFDQTTVGFYSAIGDARQGLGHNNGMFHEALTSIGAVLGASLVGIDKSNQGHQNFVGMLKNYFNRDSGWNIVQNNTTASVGGLGGGYGRDWWYDVYPNLLFYAVMDKYPQEKSLEPLARSIADRFFQADQVLQGNYDFSYFDYGLMKPMKNWICSEPDAAAGHAWVMYNAFQKFGDARYLKGTLSAMDALEKNSSSPAFEVLLPFGAYLAARLNAEQGTKYDVTKLLNWIFEPNPGCRNGWGVLVGQWNGFDISGMVGSTTDHGGYGFLMDTFDAAWPLVSMVRYDSSYAAAIGKWMLNAANVAKLFYPDHAPADHQTLPQQKEISKGVIAYEGLVHSSTMARYAQLAAPVAQGDGPSWDPSNPDISQLAVYGSAHVGIFGGIIAPTDTPGILRLDLLATDFFHAPAYPTFLYYNPYGDAKAVTVEAPSAGKFDLYDTVQGKFLETGIQGKSRVEVDAKTAAVLVFVPSGGVITHQGQKLLSDGVVFDYGMVAGTGLR